MDAGCLTKIRQRRSLRGVEFIESPAFERFRAYYLDDDEFGELQQFMMRHPEVGKVVPGSGGVRKLRWRLGGRENVAGCA